MKKKEPRGELFIFGDSWGRGCWTLPDGSYLYETQGDNSFSQFFEEHFLKVENYSRGGSSNNNTIIKLEEVLESMPHSKLVKEKNTVLVIQTEALRTLVPQLNFGSISSYHHIFNDIDYYSFTRGLIDFFYFNLNELGKKYKTRINLTGGCSDVDVDLVKKYPYINVCCVSFYSLVDKKHEPSIFTVTHDISRAIRNFTKVNERVIRAIENKQGIQSEFQNDLFGYGLDNHPSTKGVKMWAAHIYNNIR